MSNSESLVRPTEPMVFPLTVNERGYGVNDVAYIAAKYGGPNVEIGRYEYREFPQAPNQAPTYPSATPFSGVTSSSFGIGSMPIPVHTEGAPASSDQHLYRDTRPATYGWHYKSVTPTEAIRGRAVYLLTTITLPAATRSDPDIEYRMNIDTGSVPTWIFSNYIPSRDLPSGTSRNPVQIYDASKENEYGRLSQGWPDMNDKEFDISYVDGSAVRYRLHNDKMYLSNNTDNRKGWVDIQFGAVTFATIEYRMAMYDGMLGLGPDSSDSQEHISFINYLIQRRIIGYPEVTFYIQSPGLYVTDQLQGKEKSMMMFGSPVIFKPFLSTVLPAVLPVWREVAIVNDKWMIRTPKKELDGEVFETVSNGLTYIDTGCSCIWLHDKFVKDVYDLIRGSKRHATTNLYMIPRTTKFSALPSIKIQMGEGGSFLYLHPAAIVGHILPKPDEEFFEGKIQPTSMLRGNGGCEILGLPAWECMMVKLSYGTAHWQKRSHPYPPNTEATKFEWAPKESSWIRQIVPRFLDTEH